MTGIVPASDDGRLSVTSGDGGLPDVYPGRWTVTVECAPDANVPALLAAVSRFLEPGFVPSCDRCGATLRGVVCADCGTRAIHSNGHG